MIPIKASVASQTMPVTVRTSSTETTPNSSASTAPMTAVVPICSPLGCQMTKRSTPRKSSAALSIVFSHIEISRNYINFS